MFKGTVNVVQSWLQVLIFVNKVEEESQRALCTPFEGKRRRRRNKERGKEEGVEKEEEEKRRRRRRKEEGGETKRREKKRREREEKEVKEHFILLLKGKEKRGETKRRERKEKKRRKRKGEEKSCVSTPKKKNPQVSYFSLKCLTISYIPVRLLFVLVSFALRPDSRGCNASVMLCDPVES